MTDDKALLLVTEHLKTLVGKQGQLSLASAYAWGLIGESIRNHGLVWTIETLTRMRRYYGIDVLSVSLTVQASFLEEVQGR